MPSDFPITEFKAKSGGDIESATLTAISFNSPQDCNKCDRTLSTNFAPIANPPCK